MIIVTGGAGFIGSNLIRGLNQKGYDDILVVDDLSDGHKFANLADLKIADYIDKEDFLQAIVADRSLGKIKAIFHQGACVVTTEWNGRLMMQQNYAYSKALLHYALPRGISFIYASSAAVYGNNAEFREDPSCERPLNVYGYSKLLFDNYVRRLHAPTSQIVGLRYFNVYGPHEAHKGSMASVAFHFNEQIKRDGVCRLFMGSGGYGDGEQRRDFVYVRDVVDVNLWFLEHPTASGVFNVGTGQAQSFNEMANAVITRCGAGRIQYVEFPQQLRDSYQSFTQADLTSLRRVGYQKTFRKVAEGVEDYLAMNTSPAS